MEEECSIVIIVIDSATPKTRVGCCTIKLPIGGLDRMMEGAFRLQEHSLKWKNSTTTEQCLSNECVDF